MKSINACPVPAIRWVSWAAVFAALLGFHQNVVAETAWSPPIVVYQTSGVATDPALVADSQGDVHLVFVYRESNDPKAGKPNAIMYVRWHEGSWSRPVDVLVSPSGGTDNFPAIAMDKQGYLHVVWEGGAAGQVYYSRAHVSLASSARNWSPPRILSKEGSLRSSIEATPDGLLHFVYASSQGNVFYRQSKDGGQTWNAESAVSNVEGTNSASDYVRIAVDGNGRIHVVWTQFRLPTGWPPIGAFYSRSVDGGKTWSVTLQVATENYGSINVAANGDNVQMVWNGTVDIGDRMQQWSIDGGQTWTPAQKITQRIRGGFTGYPSLAFDSAGMLHLITSVDGKAGANGQPIRHEDVYHLVWNGKNWNEPVLLSNGATGKQSVELPWLAISQGNHLHVVYEDDFQRIWYTGRIIDAPAIPSQVVSTPIMTPTSTPNATPPAPIETRAPTREPTRAGNTPSEVINSASPMQPLLIGIAPVVLLVLSLVILRAVQQQH